MPAKPDRYFTVGYRSTALRRFQYKWVKLAVWERRPLLCLDAWIQNLPADQLPRGRTLMKTAQTRQALNFIFKTSVTPPSRMRDLFENDVVMLVRHFSALMNTELVDLRLEAVSNDSCWKFHRDMVPGRLITTYRGPGTQWVHPDHAATALRDQVEYSGPIQELPKYAIGLFRGNSQDADEGLVHRSPHITGSGATRLLLCLNPPSNASPAPFVL